MRTRIVLILITSLCSTTASVQSAGATTITVTNADGSSPGSLRDALRVANDGDTIDFDSSLKGQTITLTSGQLNVDKDVTISGPGAENLTVDGNSQSRVFYISLGTTVTIDGLTVANGYSDDSGGGIFSVAAALNLSNCRLINNLTTDKGGGIVNVGFFDNASMTVTNCTVSGNSAYYGGGVANTAEQGGAMLTVSNSNISDNSADFGGAISNAPGWGACTATVSNSTLSGNSADYAGGIYNAGGGNAFATMTIANSTVSGNSAASGGGIYVFGGAGFATANTIFDAGALGENIFNEGGTVTSLGYNVSSDDGGGFLTTLAIRLTPIQ